MIMLGSRPEVSVFEHELPEEVVNLGVGLQDGVWRSPKIDRLGKAVRSLALQVRGTHLQSQVSPFMVNVYLHRLGRQ